MTVHSAALVGTVGGCGTTRLAVEVGAALARAGRRALVLDLDLDTQGLAGRVPGRLAPDSTRLLTDPDVDLRDAVHAADLDSAASLDDPGTLDLCPAHAPFTRVADAKTVEAAQRLADRFGDARAAGYDAVLVDTPPVASNPAVAAVTDADRTVLVTSPDERGVDAVQRARGRLADVGTTAHSVVAVQRTGESANQTAIPDADVTLPVAPTTGPQAGPDALGAGPFAQAVVATAETILETELDVDLAPAGRMQSLRQRLS